MPKSPPPQSPDKTQAGKTANEQKWLEENRGGIDAYNKYIEKNGLPLAEFLII
jgi:post-segregation antitoxin (ccd killing protein)